MQEQPMATLVLPASNERERSLDRIAKLWDLRSALELTAGEEEVEAIEGDEFPLLLSSTLSNMSPAPLPLLLVVTVLA